MVTIPMGVRYALLKRYFVDGSYRYGRIAARPLDIDQDPHHRSARPNRLRYPVLKRKGGAVGERVSPGSAGEVI